MEENKLIKYEGGQLQRVGNAIAVTNKLLALAEPQLIPYRKKDKWGFCTADKKMAIDCIYKDVRPFQEGVAVVQFSDNTYSFINKNGTQITSETFDDANDFSNGYSVICKKPQNIVNFIKKDDDFLLPDKYISLQNFKDSVGVVQNHPDYFQSFIDKQGKYFLHNQYEELWSFSEGVAIVIKNGKRGFVDLNGQLFIPTNFAIESSFQNGFAIVSKNGRYGFIDKSYNLVTDIFFQNVAGINSIYTFEGFSENLSGVQINGKWGFIDIEGNYKIPFMYQYVRSFSNGLAAVQIDDLWGYIDTNNNFRINPKYKYAGMFSDGYAPVSLISRGHTNIKNPPFFIIDKNEKMLFDENFPIPFNFQNNIAYNHIGEYYINKNGSEYWED